MRAAKGRITSFSRASSRPRAPVAGPVPRSIMASRRSFSSSTSPGSRPRRFSSRASLRSRISSRAAGVRALPVQMGPVSFGTWCKCMYNVYVCVCVRREPQACMHAPSLHACPKLACMPQACMHAPSLHACPKLACMLKYTRLHAHKQANRIPATDSLLELKQYYILVLIFFNVV